MIPDTIITRVVARPLATDSAVAAATLKAIGFAKVSVLKRELPSETVQSMAGENGDDPNCGSDLDFKVKVPLYGNVYPNTCSQNPWENIYDLAIDIRKNGSKAAHTITLTRNICSETMIDILPGTPTDDLIQNPAERLSMPVVDDCASTENKLNMMVRDLIPGTKVLAIRARSYANFDFTSHTWDSAWRNGRLILNKASGNEALMSGIDGVEPTTVITPQGGGKHGFCGVKLNLVRGDSSSSCDVDHDNKWQDIFEFAVLLAGADGKKYVVNYTKNACRETVCDITQGTPPTAESTP
jgi:hypothetical protein